MTVCHLTPFTVLTVGRGSRRVPSTRWWRRVEWQRMKAATAMTRTMRDRWNDGHHSERPTSLRRHLSQKWSTQCTIIFVKFNSFMRLVSPCVIIGLWSRWQITDFVSTILHFFGTFIRFFTFVWQQKQLAQYDVIILSPCYLRRQSSDGVWAPQGSWGGTRATQLVAARTDDPLCAGSVPVKADCRCTDRAERGSTIICCIRFFWIGYFVSTIHLLSCRVRWSHGSDAEFKIMQKMCTFEFFRRNATHCISPYAIVVCVCRCVYVFVYAAFVDLWKTVWNKDMIFVSMVWNNTGHNL